MNPCAAVLKDMCKRNNWYFIDNDNIDSSCLWKDGLHLNGKGKERLTSNLSTCIQNFQETSVYIPT